MSKPFTHNTEDIPDKMPDSAKMRRTRKTPEEKLADLQKKQSQIQARIKQEQAKIKTTERKQDTRRKIIAGALALEHMQYDSDFATTMVKLLNRHVEREEDKNLFPEIQA